MIKTNTYRSHLTKSVKHIVNGIPTSADSSQQLQLLELDDPRRLALPEPAFGISVHNNFTEGVPTCPRCSNDPHHSTTKGDGIMLNIVVERLPVGWGTLNPVLVPIFISF